jgi:hypothetical protein
MQTTDTLFDQKPVRAITVGGTGLTLGVMLGSLGALTGHGSSGFIFEWRWWSVVGFLIGFAWNVRVWNIVWKVQANPTAANKSVLGKHLLITALIGLGAFLYPIRFVAGANYLQLAHGLSLAAVALTGVGTMIYSIGRALAKTKHRMSGN